MINPTPKIKAKRLKGKKKKELQLAVSIRDNFSCRRCGHYCGDCPPHHIKFISQGGSDIAENMICACTQCHASLHNGLIKAYGPEDKLVFSLTVAGKIAVENGKLRAER